MKPQVSLNLVLRLGGLSCYNGRTISFHGGLQAVKGGYDRTGTDERELEKRYKKLAFNEIAIS